MPESISITLPPEIRSALDDVARAEGTSPNEVINRAIKQHLFLRRFRLLRERMVVQARDEGIRTDDDVFERVS